jgi:hypothetical protein
MGKYLKEARVHIDRIQYYYNHAGFRGYSQAEYHYSKLSDLTLRAERSKHDKNDAIVIRVLRESVGRLMEEMKRRKEDDGND